MIPWKMWFYGVRDYEPAVLDLSGENDHIMITGPNGAGKSTMTYCIGAVLYSSKVVIEGLKSHNLMQDEVWRAQIRLLFKNTGITRIDAPEYIQFTLNLHQDPGQPIKKEYVVSQGDQPEEWSLVTKYTSGDRQYNFSAYKDALQYNYKLDPDLFYLIWYQQEVNQFAVMHPEERFRRFAEMHGIDEIQRNWEESLEKLKETEEELGRAEINVSNTKQHLKYKRQDLDRYEDNRRRLAAGGTKYFQSLMALEDYYASEQIELNKQMEQLAVEFDEKEDEITQLTIELERINQGISNITTELAEVVNKEEAQSEEQQNLRLQIEQLTEMTQSLQAELNEISAEKANIKHTREEIQQLLSDTEAQLKTLEEEIINTGNREKQSKDHQEELITQQAELHANIKRDQSAEKQHNTVLMDYENSFHVQQQLEQLDQQIRQNKYALDEQTRMLGKWEAEIERLKDERDLSDRQQVSLAYFRSKQIMAYALNDLLELSDSAPLKAENLFNAIKYTVFFDGKTATPPNDLYHVPLHKVVPERSVMELTEQKVHVKRELSEEKLPHAMKALWWVGQFFQKDDFRINESGILLDQMGIRGAQEPARYLLSTRARLVRMQEVESLLQQTKEQISDFSDEIAQGNQRYQELNNVLIRVQEAEAFKLKELVRQNRLTKWNNVNKELDELKESLKELDKAKLSLIRQQTALELKNEEYQLEENFYQRYDQYSDKYEQLHNNQKVLNEWNAQLLLQEKDLQQIRKRLDELTRRKENNERNLQNQNEHLRTEKQALDFIIRQQASKKDELLTSEKNKVHNTREIEDFKQLVPELHSEIMQKRAEEQQTPQDEQTKASGNKLKFSLSEIRYELEAGKAQFEFARNEQDIDPAAPGNYKTMEQEYQRIEGEYSQTKLLFEQNRERTEEMENNLETSINMRVLQIKQRFGAYMSKFQFEGEISWTRSELRKGRIHFELHIKARKEGHQGALEDVGIKARGGRVGKGVSGGEESLSSLLFALALLQNLQTAPDFIVMDEFDSALDEGRKIKVFDLYSQELKRKLIILSPKAHDGNYLDRFTKAYIVQHDPSIPKSRVIGLKLKRETNTSLTSHN